LCVLLHELVFSGGVYELQISSQVVSYAVTYEIISLKLLIVLSTSERSVT
jgi:hypothetical protein